MYITYVCIYEIHDVAYIYEYLYVYVYEYECV